jgi:molybdenum cofactor cytidylyltransferase
MIVGILLAAGESRRFGSRKLLHPLADGTPIGVRSAENLASAVDRAIAVVAPGDGQLIDCLAKTALAICACPRSHEGMGASLACGVRATSDASGWVIALADMPFVLPSTIALVAQALRDGAPIAAPEHAGERGHPVGIASEYYPELAALGGDVGARHILQRDRSRIVVLAVDDPGIHRDIDAPEDVRPEERGIE